MAQRPFPQQPPFAPMQPFPPQPPFAPMRPFAPPPQCTPPRPFPPNCCPFAPPPQFTPPPPFPPNGGPFSPPQQCSPRRPFPPNGPNGGAVGKGKILSGKYKMGNLLGKGSFGKVYAARSVRDGAAVAIKVIKKPPTADAAMVQQISREVEAMRRLHHPNILRLHEVLTAHSKIYLVMELARGGDLHSKLARSGGRLSEPAARHYFRQVVSALHYCHQRGVTHRDVKPQNILLDERDNVKLSDFGISFVAARGHEATLLHTDCGTQAFTAPEVASCHGGRGYDGSKADAWSCGVVLFMLLVGNLPFDGKNLPALHQKIPAFISNPARSIIARLLDPNPGSRMSIETVMGTSWINSR